MFRLTFTAKSLFCNPSPNESNNFRPEFGGLARENKFVLLIEKYNVKV